MGFSPSRFGGDGLKPILQLVKVISAQALEYQIQERPQRGFDGEQSLRTLAEMGNRGVKAEKTG
jgi:hypothetical protein